jgi:hypothetical protein
MFGADNFTTVRITAYFDYDSWNFIHENTILFGPYSLWWKYI